MKHMNLYNIARACGGRLLHQGRELDLHAMANAQDAVPGRQHAREMVFETEASGVALDSRMVEEGFVFIATRGERVDGHSFIPAVFEKGALAVVCEKLPEHMPGPCILVEDSFQALQGIAEFYRRQLHVKVIGITGSVGKTSTKEFVAGVLKQKYKVFKTEANLNNEIGVPLMVLQITEDTEAAVLEMGINHFGEMKRLSRIVRPDICVLTNIGQCHLEYLGSRDGILKAKSEIFDFMQEDGSVCINGDDDKLATIGEVRGKRPVTFGFGEGNTVTVSDREGLGLFGSRAVLHIDGEAYPITIPLPGEHMIYNAMAAAAVGSMLGLGREQIREGIRSVRPVSGRSNILALPDKTVIDDCYNANPVSVKAAIDLLSTALTGKTAILGDMFELGDGAEAMHAETGVYAVQKDIDRIICAGELSRHMYEAAVKAAGSMEKKAESGREREIYYFATRDELLHHLPEMDVSGDTILVKASHGMGFEEVVAALKG